LGEGRFNRGSTARVVAVQQRPQVASVNMRVELRARWLAVPEQLLQQIRQTLPAGLARQDQAALLKASAQGGVVRLALVWVFLGTDMGTLRAEGEPLAVLPHRSGGKTCCRIWVFLGIFMGMKDYRIILPKQIPTDLVNKIAEIDEFKGRWEALKTIAPDSLSRLQRVATIASIGSSTRIEGAQLTDAQIDELLSHVDKRSFQSRDEEEVAGYAEAMQIVFDSAEDIPITENHIKQLHGILLNFSSKDTRHKGEYKKLPNNVEAFDADGNSVGVVFETATPFDTPFYMERLVQWYRAEMQARDFHPLLLIGAFVVHFLAIHPFQDGNGRLSRILTTLMLLQNGYLYVPYCSLESIIEKNKEQYYLALRKAQKSFTAQHTGMKDWLGYFLRILIKQKTILQQRIEQDTQLALGKLSPLSTRIVQTVTQRQKTTISDIVTLLNINRNTAKKHLKDLAAKKLIRQNGTGKGTWYSPV
jgi:Fic family protein